jgi:coenzyme F420-reducing hydrogenase delta subunit
MKPSDVHIFVCTNCVPNASRLPRQWKQGDTAVRLQEFPCSGKVDGQYVMRALEGGAKGLCVVTCANGECRLAEGNRRADIRVQTAKKLLSEIGMEPERLQLVNYEGNGNGNGSDTLRKLMRDAVDRLSHTGESPLGAH